MESEAKLICNMKKVTPSPFMLSKKYHRSLAPSAQCLAVPVAGLPEAVQGDPERNAGRRLLVQVLRLAGARLHLAAVHPQRGAQGFCFPFSFHYVLSRFHFVLSWFHVCLSWFPAPPCPRSCVLSFWINPSWSSFFRLPRW